jgi:hypothetical protein
MDREAEAVDAMAPAVGDAAPRTAEAPPIETLPDPFDRAMTEDDHVNAEREAEKRAAREAEARVIATSGGVTRDKAGKSFAVKSGKETARYKVSKENGVRHCTCPARKFDPATECKHILAVAYFLETEAAGTAETPKVSEHEAANLRAAFQERGVPPAEWLQAHGIESGLCEDATVDVFNLAMCELYN